MSNPTRNTRRYNRILFATRLTVAGGAVNLLGVQFPRLPVVGTSDPYPAGVYVGGFILMWLVLYAAHYLFFWMGRQLNQPEAKTAEELDSHFAP